MPSVLVNFSGEFGKKQFEFDQSITVETMLKTFLNETNSRLTLEPGEITFAFKMKILNNPNFLNKSLSEVFRSGNRNDIKIMDCAGVIGSGK